VDKPPHADEIIDPKSLLPWESKDERPMSRALAMSDGRAGTISQLLRAWGRGDEQAREDLVPLVYQELRRRASAYLRRERPDHTLQPTSLVHEAYIRLMAQTRVSWLNRAQFFALAAQLMRRILVDHARERQAGKRPGGIRVTFDEGLGAVPPPDCELLMLDDALRDLARLDPRQAEIVELKYFGGLSEPEVAAVLSLSRATVTREWQSARAWLYRRITKGRVARP
jgi:RNA polymerase sigma factor (TIGR02999 family)